MNKTREIRIEKVTLNIGAGKSTDKLEKGLKLFELLTSAKPVKTFTTLKRVVNSRGGSTNQGTSSLFVRTEEQFTQLAPLVAQLRVSVVTENLSENAQIWVFMETTNDGLAWNEVGTALRLGGQVPTNWINSGTVTTTDWWAAISELQRGPRIGVKVKQGTGTNVEMGTVQLVIDFELRS